MKSTPAVSLKRQIFTAADVFGADPVGALEFFLITEEIAISNNFILNLNGNNQGNANPPTSESRVSLHSPWAYNRTYFFDLGNAYEQRNCYGPGHSTVCENEEPFPFGVTAFANGWVDHEKSKLVGSSIINVNGGMTDQRESFGSVYTNDGLRFGQGVKEHNFGEYIAYNRALSLPERQKIEGYLAWKWGEVKNLPVNHPYKNYPPQAE